MSEKFTPGPWSVEHSEAQDIYWVESETSGTVGVCDLYSMDGSVSWSKDNAEANAHLIASAPDLYEACADIESKIVDFEAGRINWRPDDFLMRVRAAMAKARGEVS